MRKIMLVLGVLALLASAGCGGESEQCQQGSTCQKGGSWQACCTSTDCRYKMSDGTVYNCAGTNCGSGNPSAAAQAVAWCQAH